MNTVKTHEQVVRELMGEDYFNPETESYGQKQGYEVSELEGDVMSGGSDIFEMLAVHEVNSGFWADSVEKPTAIEDAGIYNVAPLKRWSAKRVFCEDSKHLIPTATAQAHKARGDAARFDAIGFANQTKVIANRRALHGIEDIVNKAPSGSHKTTQVQRRMKALNRRMAVIEARNSRS